MSKKLKKAIRDSFAFPEASHKEEFFGQPFLSDNRKRRRKMPVIFRVIAAAAALVLGAGVWNAVRVRPEHGTIDVTDDLPAVTEVISTSSVTQYAETTTAADTTKKYTTATVSEKNTFSSASTSSKTTKTTAAVSDDTRVTTTNKITSAPYISTETAAANNSDFISDIERSFSMKKISAFAASLVVMTSNTPAITTDAANSKSYMEYMRDDYLKYSSINQRHLDKVAEKKSNLDFNEDGSFDMWDVYAFYRSMVDLNNSGEIYVNNDGTETYIPPVYTVPDNIKSNVAEYGDFSGNKEIDDLDFELLVGYYSSNYPVTYDFVDPNYYYFNCPDNYLNPDAEGILDKGVKLWTIEEFFKVDIYNHPNVILQYVQDLTEYMMRVYGGYSTFCDMVDRGMITLDIDGDGDFTISDLYDIVGGDSINYWEQLPEYGKGDEDHEIPQNTFFTESEWKKLRDNSNICRYSLSYAEEYSIYYVTYFFEHNEFKKAYADRHFFDNMRGGLFKQRMYDYMFDYLKYAMPGVYSPRFDYTQDEIKKDFINYYTKVKSGLLPEPDINMNGTIEFEDYIYADLILSKEYMPDDPKSPEFDKAIIDNFRENCDFNENLMSGDLSDVVCIQLYVVKELGIPEDDVRNEIARYYKKHPEIDIYDYEHYVLPEEEAPEFDGTAKAVTGVQAIRSYMSNIDLFAIRNGDANDDGETNMADAVLIMQSYANPDKYKLTDKGSFNADISSTGDGITPKDAQKIQKLLLGLE